MMTNNRKPQVLIVDDEVDLVDILAFQVTDAGFDAKVAHSGEEAWKILQTESVDLVISDMRMPDGGGELLLERIRKKHPDKPPVILLSGFADIEQAEAQKMGAHVLLKKPMDIPKVIPTVCELLK